MVGLILLWLTATAWARPLLLPDEGRYVGVAWEMLRSHDWLTPTLDGMPFFHKPPLFYWITAGSLSLFGFHELAARAAPIVGATIGALALYLFVRRWAGHTSARLALAALLVQPLFYLGGQFANLDMLVAGLIAATIVLLADAALSAGAGLPYRRTLVAAYAVAALGVLAKGLIGVAIPGLVLFAWLAVMQQWRTMWRLVSVPGLAAFMLIAAPWFVAMESRFPDFVHYFFVVQHFKRFAASGFNNVQPFWFYPAVLIVFSLPFLPWLVRAVRVGGLTEGEDAPLRLLLWLWLLMVTLFFSLPHSKPLGYILPVAPALAGLMADGFTRRARGTRAAPSRLMWRISVGVAAVLSIGTVAEFTFHPVRSTRDIGLALRAQRGPGDAVFMLHQYAYDVPFYARLDAPVTVVEDWADPQWRLRDDWRKELADAGAFAPARAAATLIEPAALPAALCRTPVSWIIGSASAGAAQPALAPASVVARQGQTWLWRVDLKQPGLSAALHCTTPARAAAQP